MPKQTLITSHAKRKMETMLKAWQLLLSHPKGLHPDDLATVLDIDRATIFRYFAELGAYPVMTTNAKGKQVRSGLWTVDATPDDVALAEAILSRR